MFNDPLKQVDGLVEQAKDLRVKQVAQQKVIIYAGVKSISYDEEAGELKQTLEEQGYEVIKIIPINGLDHPEIEYLKE